METEVRICGHKRFHHGVWRVLIDRHKWLYDENDDCFIRCYDRFNGYKHLWVIHDSEDEINPMDRAQQIAKKDMPIPVQVGFYMAGLNNKHILNEKYPHRHSHAWQIFIGNLRMRNRDFVIVSRGRRMGVIQLVKDGNLLTNTKGTTK